MKMSKSLAVSKSCAKPSTTFPTARAWETRSWLGWFCISTGSCNAQGSSLRGTTSCSSWPFRLWPRRRCTTTSITRLRTTRRSWTSRFPTCWRRSMRFWSSSAMTWSSTPTSTTSTASTSCRSSRPRSARRCRSRRLRASKTVFSCATG